MENTDALKIILGEPGLIHVGENISYRVSLKGYHEKTIRMKSYIYRLDSDSLQNEIDIKYNEICLCSITTTAFFICHQFSIKGKYSIRVIVEEDSLFLQEEVQFCVLPAISLNVHSSFYYHQGILMKKIILYIKNITVCDINIEDEGFLPKECMNITDRRSLYLGNMEDWWYNKMKLKPGSIKKQIYVLDYYTEEIPSVTINWISESGNKGRLITRPISLSIDEYIPKVNFSAEIIDVQQARSNPQKKYFSVKKGIPFCIKIRLYRNTDDNRPASLHQESDHVVPFGLQWIEALISKVADLSIERIIFNKGIQKLSGFFTISDNKKEDLDCEINIFVY
eukprot:GHVP01038171.1.p1 GENE.GHVP01038171.1~~GHVP01038171.1.p1  ORF type:complete len:338 (+),score=49.21 GHVP01038171.1:711-1724(+)